MDVKQLSYFVGVAVPGSFTRAIQAQLPGAQLSITEGLSAGMQEQLGNGRLDIAVLYNAQPLPGIELTPLAHEELLLVQAAADAPATRGPIGLRELARLPLIIPSRPNAIRMQVEIEMTAAGCQPDVVLEIDGVPAILDLVAGGAGCAVLSRNAVASAPRPAAFSVRRIETARAPTLQIRLYTAVSALRPTTRTQQAALALVRASAAERFDAL